MKQRVDELERETSVDAVEVVRLAYHDEPWSEILKCPPHLLDFKSILVGINNFSVERP